MYLLRAQGESHAGFAKRMRNGISDALLALDPTALSLTVTEAPPPKPSLFPFKSAPVAVFGVADGDGDPSRFSEVLNNCGAEVSGYQVDESYPVPYPRTWRDGEPTPNPILLTVLHKKPNISESEYIERWHNGHTPLSLKIHPLWYYQRNVIVEPITDSAEACDGIVLEACPTKSDLLNPVRFYGGPLMMVPNILRVAYDIQGFLDMKRTETFYATEYQLRS